MRDQPSRQRDAFRHSVTTNIVDGEA